MNPSLLTLWTRLLPETLTPRQVDADLRRHGADPERVRALVDTLGHNLDPSFAAGVLAGIRFALLGGHALRSRTTRATLPHRQVIPFPSMRVRSA